MTSSIVDLLETRSAEKTTREHVPDGIRSVDSVDTHGVGRE